MNPVTTTVLGQSERQFERAVVEFAEFNCWRVFHPFDSRRSNPGWPDLSMVRTVQPAPRLVFAELKTERGKLRKAQTEWLAALGLVPYVEVYVWRPSAWDEVERVLAA